MSIPPPQRQVDNWRDAEVNAALWMRYWGYPDARAEPGGSDGGIDVVATHAIAQVKFQGAPVGRPALQNLVGANMGSMRQLFFFTGSNFAGPAIAYADHMSIALFRYDPWGRMEPMNGWAQKVIDSKSSTTDPDAIAGPVARAPSPVPDHLKRHWAAWLTVGFLLAPFGSISDPTVYTGPLWLDALKLVGIFAGLWCLAVVFTVVYAQQRGFRHPFAPWVERLRARLHPPGE